LSLPISSVIIPLPPRSTLFPYTTLFRSHLHPRIEGAQRHHVAKPLDQLLVIKLARPGTDRFALFIQNANDRISEVRNLHRIDVEDRKSTRLNSSHVKISYAVFCLKKKNM